MNVILLSGGSGKRLWPLSNDIRSKQFIKLFKDTEGEYESMVQRVYRQITAVDTDAKITIATGKSQVSAIRNQLMADVSICVEQHLVAQILQLLYLLKQTALVFYEVQVIDNLAVQLQ